MPLHGLILDYGEVLTRKQPRDVVQRMASIAHLPLDEFMSRYWRHRVDYDRGLTGEDYWRRVLDASGGEYTEAIRQLIEADFLSWSDYREQVWEIAAAFRARGGRTAMLTNGVVEIVDRLRRERRLERWFDVVVASCEVGVCKPDPEIYRICVQRLGTTAQSTLFVDDRIENVNAAESVGLRAFHFTDDSSVPNLRSALLNLNLEP